MNVFIEAIKNDDLTEDAFSYEQLLSFTTEQWREVQDYFSDNYSYPDDSDVDLDFSENISSALGNLLFDNENAHIISKIGLVGTTTKIPYPEWSHGGFWSGKHDEIQSEIEFVENQIVPIVRDMDWDYLVPGLDLLSDFGLCRVISECELRSQAQQDFYRDIMYRSGLIDTFPMSQFLANVLAKGKVESSIERGDIPKDEVSLFSAEIPLIDFRMALLIWSEDYYQLTSLVLWQMADYSWFGDKMSSIESLNVGLALELIRISFDKLELYEYEEALVFEVLSKLEAMEPMK